MNCSIRMLKESDLPHINQLFTQTVHAINVRDYAQEQLDVWAPKDRAAEYWKTRLKDHVVYVAESQGIVVGFANITKDGYLDHLYVHKDFQGQGVASALLHQLEEVARNMGLQELRTEASITAKPFFEKKGFVVVRKQDKKHNGMVFVSYYMQKKI